MSAGWKQTTLGDVVDFKGGGTPSTENPAYWSGDNPWVSPKDMKSSEVGDSIDKITEEAIENSAASLISKNAILVVVRSGILARTIPVAITTRPLAVNQDIKALCPQEDVDPHFLHYFMQKSEPELLKLVTRGATVHRLSTESLKSLPFGKPPFPEQQQRIVAILDEAFAGLATATANAEKNLRNTRELSAVAFAFIFKGGSSNWPITTIGDQVMLQRGFDITKRQQTFGQVPVISSGGIKSFHDTAMARGPGVVLGRKGSLGTVFYLDQDYWPHDTTLWVKDFKGNNPKFVYYFFKGLDLAKLDTGAANPALNRNVVHPLTVNWPSKDKQAEIVQRIEPIATEAERLQSLYQRKLTQIGDLKQSILQQAFSGEVTAPPPHAIKEAAE